MRIFETLARSWDFAKISYGIIWDHKQLMVLPILSTIAAFIVVVSFVAPLWASGLLETWFESAQQVEESGATATTTADQQANPLMWVLLFAFYFANYFVIVFFNSALTACAMQVLRGEPASLGYGLGMAGKRIPQIAGWALVSAVVGVVLKMIENANEKAGYFISAILGSAWTALTYFVVPVIVMDGVGPVTAFKNATGILKKTWGTALAGNFSLGLLGFLVALPSIIISVLLIMGAFSSGSTPLIAASFVVAAFLMTATFAMTSAADGVFKAVLYNYATGRAMPNDIDTQRFDEAFKPKSKS